MFKVSWHSVLGWPATPAVKEQAQFEERWSVRERASWPSSVFDGTVRPPWTTMLSVISGLNEKSNQNPQGNNAENGGKRRKKEARRCTGLHLRIYWHMKPRIYKVEYVTFICCSCLFFINNLHFVISNLQIILFWCIIYTDLWRHVILFMWIYQFVCFSVVGLCAYLCCT